MMRSNKGAEEKDWEERIEDKFCLILSEIGDQVQHHELYKKNTVFISYAWEDEEGVDATIYKYQRKHVDDLARYLKRAGIRVIYDGHSRSYFLSDLLKDVKHNCDFIILIGTPALEKKLKDDKPHVIKEEMEIIYEKLHDHEWKNRIIPILLTGTRAESFPDDEVFDDILRFDFSPFFESRIGRKQEDSKKNSSCSFSSTYYDLFFDLLIRLYEATEFARGFISNKKQDHFFHHREVRDLLVPPPQMTRSDHRREFLFNFPPSFSPYRRPKEKFDAFEHGTREWLVTKMSESLVEKDSAKAVFLLSEAGMGKSTLFGYISMRYCKEMANKYSYEYEMKDVSPLNVVALHFFNYYDLDDKSIETGLRSISFQLCETIPGFANCLARNQEELEKNLEKFKYNVKSLFNFLILAPAHTLSDIKKAPEKKCVILLDALDECEDPVEFTKILHECFVNAPNWLVLIASSRPEHGLKQEIKQKDKIINLIPSQEENQRDLRVFIQQRMNKYYTGHLVESMIAELVEKSGGLFLWLSFQEEEIKLKLKESEGNDFNDLQNIINKLPSGIEESYKTYFQRLFDRLKGIYPNQDVNALYRSLVSIGLILPRAPLPESIWKASLGFVQSNLDDQERYKKLKDAASCLLVFSNDHLRAPHKSMIDWLCEQDGENTAVGMEQFHLAIDKKSQKENHLKLLEIFQSIYSKVDPNLTYKFHFPRKLTIEEQFAFTHALYHCCESGQLNEAKKWLLDVKHLFWLVYQAVKNNDYLRFVQDVMLVEEKLDSNLYYLSNLIRLSRTAVEVDPRQIINQIIGRVPKNNFEKELLLATCEDWLKEKPNELKLIMPVNISMSGLDKCDSALKTVFEGHNSIVKSICLSNDDKTLFTFSEDKTARSWNVKTGQGIHIFEGHTDRVNSICLSNDNTILFTCSNDKTARSWNVETGQQIQVFVGHISCIYSICLSKDCKSLFTCSEDKTSRSWNIETGQQIHVFEGHTDIVNSICLSKDDKPTLLYTCSSDKTARSWNVETGQQIQVFEGHTDIVNSICLSNDDKTLFTCSFENTRSWNVETGQQIHVFKGHIDDVNSICLSNDDKILFTCSSDKTVRSWNVITGQQIYTFEGHTHSVDSICLSKDDKTLFTCSGDKTARSWNVEIGQQNHLFEVHTSDINSIRLSNDGKILFTCGSFDKTARGWKIETGIPQYCMKEAPRIDKLCLSNDCKTLCGTSLTDGTIRIWDVINSGQLIRGDFKQPNYEITIMTISNDKKTLFFSEFDEVTVRSWDLESGQQINVFKGHSFINSLCLSDDDKTLFSSSDDGIVRSWNVSNGEQKHVFRGGQTTNDDIDSIFLLNDSKLLLAYSTKNNRYYLWDVETGKEIVENRIIEQTILQYQNNYETTADLFSSSENLIGFSLLQYCKRKGNILYGRTGNFYDKGGSVILWHLLAKPCPVLRGI